jgi:hypothetical protein
MTLPLKRSLLIPMLFLMSSSGILAQGLQTVRGVGETAVQRQVDLLYVAVQQCLTKLRQQVLLEAAAGLPVTRAAVARAFAAGQRVLQAREDRRLFEERLGEFLLAEEQALGTLPLNISSMDATEAERVRTTARLLGEAASTAPPISAIQTLVPDVSFTASYGTAVTRAAHGGIGVNSNLHGAAAGAAFDALGSKTLQDYFTNNLGVGAQIPTSGNGKLSSAIGLGLGGVTLGKYGFWPALGLQEFDSRDQTLSTVLTTQNPEQKTWSQLTFGVGVPLYGLSGAIERICQGRLAPVLSVGVSLPYFYPGDAYTALGAVFTSRRNDYVHVSGTRFLVAVDVPLLKVGAHPTYDAETGTCKPSK